MVPGPSSRQPGLSPTQGPDARAVAPHGLRGGGLPQHRRVLAAWDRDLHDPGRHLYPLLRLLQCEAWDAGHHRSGRTGAPGGGSLGARPGLCRGHVRRSRRPAGRWRVAVRGIDPCDPPARPRLPSRGADPRLFGPRGIGRGSSRRRPRHPEPQPGDGRTSLSHRARRRTLPLGPQPARPRAALPPGRADQVGRYGWPGGNGPTNCLARSPTCGRSVARS